LNWNHADILAELARQKTSQIIVGFAAETENVLENARKKLASKSLDAIVVNDVSREGVGFDSDRNAVTIISHEEVVEVPETSKWKSAQRVLDQVVKLCSGLRSLAAPDCVETGVSPVQVERSSTGWFSPTRPAFATLSAMPRTLNPELRRALADRIRYYNELGSTISTGVGRRGVATETSRHRLRWPRPKFSPNQEKK